MTCPSVLTTERWIASWVVGPCPVLFNHRQARRTASLVVLTAPEQGWANVPISHLRAVALAISRPQQITPGRTRDPIEVCSETRVLQTEPTPVRLRVVLRLVRQSDVWEQSGAISFMARPLIKWTSQ